MGCLLMDNGYYDKYFNNYYEDDNFIDYKQNFNSGDIDLVKLYLHEIGKFKIPNEEDVNTFFKNNYQNDIEKRDEFVKRNLKLVVYFAKKYRSYGLSFLDLIQEGNIGLMKAINKYDYTKGYKFSTYAKYWIRITIERSILNTGKTIRIPVYMDVKVKKLLKIEQYYKKEIDRLPTDNEIVDLMNISFIELKKIKNCLQKPISLDMKIGDNNDTLKDVYFSKQVPNLEDFVLDLIDLNDIDKYFLYLNEMEEFLLRLRYEFYGYCFKYDEIVSMFHVSRQRISKIEQYALLKIRKNLILSYLKLKIDYIDNDSYLSKYKILSRVSKAKQEILLNIFNDMEKLREKKMLLRKENSKSNYKLIIGSNIFQIFDEYDRKLVRRVINSMEDKSLKTIINWCGEDLSKKIPIRINTNSLESYNFLFTLMKINDKLEDEYNKITKVENIKKGNVYTIKKYYENKNYSDFINSLEKISISKNVKTRIRN